MSWMKVCGIDEIPSKGARVVRTGRGDVAVFRTANDSVFALDDRCPHKGGPLSQGIVFDNRVACPLHNWVIDLDQGCAVGPDVGCTQRHLIKIEDGQIFLKLGTAVEAMM